MKDVNGNKLPQWALDEIAAIKSRPRRKPVNGKIGMITVIPDGIEPEVWAAQNGLV